MLPAATQASMHLCATHSQAGEALKRPEGGQEAAAPLPACASVALGSAENRGLRKGAKSAFNTVVTLLEVRLLLGVGTRGVQMQVGSNPDSPKPEQSTDGSGDEDGGHEP